MISPYDLSKAAGAFHISLGQVNWLGQVVNLIYLPMALAIPTLVRRFGIRYMVSRLLFGS